MADQKASFAVELQDQVSSGALSATDALTKLQDQLAKDTKALADMQKAMRQLKGATSADVKQPMEEVTKRMAALKDQMAQSQGVFVALGGKFGQTGRSSAGFRDHLLELQKATQVMPGPIGGVINKVVSYTASLTPARLGTLALGAAFLGAAAGAAVFAKSLFGDALEAGDARRNELLHLEALSKMRNMYGFIPAKAAEVQDAIDKVSGSVSISREKVAVFAEQLQQGGLHGENLRSALEGASIKASALGDAAGSAFAGFATSVALGGGSVKRLADDVKNRFGSVVQKQMSSLAVQQLKQKENWASLFRGVNVEPVLSAMKALRDILNLNTASGQALKSIFGSMLKPLFSAAETGLVFMRRFFKQMLIGALELKIAYQEVRNWFARTFGKPQVTQASSLLDKIQLGRVSVYILAAAFSYLAATSIVSAISAISSFAVALLTTVIPAVWSAVAAATSFAVSIVAVTWPFLLAAVAVAAFVAGVAALYDLWNEIDWTDLGRSLWKGIVNGLEAGWDAIKNAVSGLAHKAASAFKTVLGIASPSKVFAEFGYSLPEGVAKGVELGTPKAQLAAANMVQAPPLGASTQSVPSDAAPTAGARHTATSSRNISIGQLHIHAESSNPKALAVAFRRELESVLEGVAHELGAPPLGAAP